MLRKMRKDVGNFTATSVLGKHDCSPVAVHVDVEMPSDPCKSPMKVIQARKGSYHTSTRNSSVTAISHYQSQADGKDMEHFGAYPVKE